jgi:hypothetical protein
MARQMRETYDGPTQGPDLRSGPGRWGRGTRDEFRHHHHHHGGLQAEEWGSRWMRGPDGDGPDRGGPERGGPERGGPERGGPERGGRRRPWDDDRAFGRGGRGGRDPQGHDREGREAVVSLITAVRQVVRVGDHAQRESARIVIDDAVRSIWSILAQGPTAPPVEPVMAAPDADETPAAADPAGQGEAGAATDAATDA